MVQLPVQPDNTETTLFKLEALRKPQRRGRTVAMSTIGDPCSRKLWYLFRWVGPPREISIQLQNLFDTGTRAEDFIIHDLESIGIKITKRQEEIWGFGKFAHGFTDGQCIDVPEAPKTEHLLEIKTHNDKNFKVLQKKGVKQGYPTHYGQVQRYMKALKLTRCLYVGYAKNTSHYYIERIRFDPSYANDLIRKEEAIIMSPVAPNRPDGFFESYYLCGWCEFKDFCYNYSPAHVTCRTCKYVDQSDGGNWICTFDNGEHIIPIEVQETGCDHYEIMPLE